MAKYSINITTNSYEEMEQAIAETRVRLKLEHERRITEVKVAMDKLIQEKLVSVLEDLGYNPEDLDNYPGELEYFAQATSYILAICERNINAKTK